ncbi:MAG: serine hydrolase [Candidatus Poribacteria bacterium]|nr:serine hydrolase [Candidatus Poribacteria bacterium]
MKTYVYNLIGLLVCCGLIVLLCGTTVIHAAYDPTIDSPLEQTIDSLVKQFRPRKGLTYSDRTSFVVYDISRNKKLVSINEDRQMMAASLIKNFVMLAYFHEVKHGRLKYTDRSRYHLRKMIQVSSNVSTNYFINLIGGPSKVSRILKYNYSYFKQTKIVERIPTNGRTYRNKTSAHDLNKFYVQLWHDKLPYSHKMKVYLGLPNGDYIYKKTRIPASAKVYNKTGTVYGLVGDSGIIVMRDPKGKLRPYVFTGLIEDRSKPYGRRRISFGAWVNQRANVLRRVSEKAYGYIYKSYGGRW